MSAKIIAITNQKGGVAKTTTTVNLGIGLARQGKKVLLIDCDPQASLTISLGQHTPDNIAVTLATLLAKVISDEPISPNEGVLHHEEGVDFIPSSLMLAAMDSAMNQAISRETILNRYLDTVRDRYDYILLDCLPSLGILNINALTTRSPMRLM